MDIPTHTDQVPAAHCVVDDAVGVPDRRWFVAIVKHNSEKISAERLSQAGYETYVASQQEYRIWRNGRKKLVDRIVIPSMVFLHATEHERLQAVKHPNIYRFLTDRAGDDATGRKPVAVIPDLQIQKLRFMLGHAERPVAFAPQTFAKGDRVKVVRGPLLGLEGEVIADAEGNSELLIDLDILGCARVAIDPADLSKAN